jgi:hypothetical protein
MYGRANGAPQQSSLEAEIVGGILWHEGCKAAQPALPESIPINFESVQEYMCTFQPLLLEEAREAVRNTISVNLPLL